MRSQHDIHLYVAPGKEYVLTLALRQGVVRDVNRTYISHMHANVRVYTYQVF